jgi:hypothetical protein
MALAVLVIERLICVSQFTIGSASGAGVHCLRAAPSARTKALAGR